MKKKTKVFILLVLLASLVGLGIAGNSYYQDRYVGKPYYAKVAADQETSLEDIKDINGNKADVGRSYSLWAYSPEGEKRKVEFDIVGKDSTLLQPNEYLEIQASKQLVVSWKRIARDEVPKNVLKNLDK